MKKYLFSAAIVLCSVVIVSCSNATSGSQATKDAIAKAFSEKYDRPTTDFLIETERDTGSFAKGSVRIQGEMGGALWFGAKTEKGWELASDGQGPMSCNIANTYQFPKDMVPTCLDAKNANALIQR